MEENREKDLIQQENDVKDVLAAQDAKNVYVPEAAKQENYNLSTQFSENVDKAKQAVLAEATQNDAKFVDEFKQKLKAATLKLAEVEKSKAAAENAKAELAEKNVQYQKELVDTKQKLNEYQQIEDKWNNKQRSREFHYNGVKDVMLCIGIKNPMCIPLLYLLFPIALIFFLGKCCIQATFGNLLCGAIDSNRPKAMKGFLWTILVFFVLCILALGIYLALTYLILPKA